LGKVTLVPVVGVRILATAAAVLALSTRKIFGTNKTGR
jgi:hypothetical protein